LSAIDTLNSLSTDNDFSLMLFDGSYRCHEVVLEAMELYADQEKEGMYSEKEVIEIINRVRRDSILEFEENSKYYIMEIKSSKYLKHKEL
jgi:hypothetical protein